MRQLDQYIQTDGSDATLQYARKVNNTTWEYMEWIDNPWEDFKMSAEWKLAHLDAKSWRVEEIDLMDYSKEEIEDAISTYGYTIYDWVSCELFNIKQSREIFSVEASIQLSIECLFEMEL